MIDIEEAMDAIREAFAEAEEGQRAAAEQVMRLARDLDAARAERNAVAAKLVAAEDRKQEREQAHLDVQIRLISTLQQAHDARTIGEARRLIAAGLRVVGVPIVAKH